VGTILNIIAAVHEVGSWLIRVSMLLVIIRRHRPQSALVWLLVIFFSPWVGLALYAFLGSNRLPQKRVDQHKRFLERIDALRGRFNGSPGITRPQLEPAFASTVRLAQRLGHMSVLGGNHAEILCDNDEFLDRIIADIEGASIMCTRCITSTETTRPGGVLRTPSSAPNGAASRAASWSIPWGPGECSRAWRRNLRGRGWRFSRPCPWASSAGVWRAGICETTASSC